MLYLSTFLLAVASNLDILQISLSYGIKKIYLPKSSILLVSILSTISMFISMYIGQLLNFLLTNQIADIFGAILLCFLGISFIVEDIKLQIKSYGYDTSHFYENPLGYNKILENPIIIDKDNSHHIDLKESLHLYYAVALNNIFTFFAASLTGFTFNLSLFLYFVVSLSAIKLGLVFYKLSILKFLAVRCNLISGLILIFLAISEVFTLVI